MTINEYQEKAMRTDNKAFSNKERMMNAILGLFGEGGEVADIIKKSTFQGHPINDETLDHLKEEVGDILWYVALAAKSLDMDLETIAKQNIEKLEERYPDGFSAEKSIHREENNV